MGSIDFLERELAARQEQDKLRQLKTPSGLVDLTSNDYLGLARPDCPLNGATGSRLLTGNHPLVEELEQRIADFHRAEAALLFSSGYTANLGLLSTLVDQEDSIILDAESHASSWDGAKLSQAQVLLCRHNDPEYLERQILRARSRVFVSVEGLYSMSGDLAPLREIHEVCERHGARLIVDEAHSTGIIGPQGRGLVSKLRMEQDVFARVHTFGKAVGAHGAVVLGSRTLIDYLINFCRPFIYSTGLPLSSIALIRCAYKAMESANAEREQLNALINRFRKKVPSKSPSAIQCLPVSGGNSRVKAIAAALQDDGLDVRPILHPTVRRGQERLRICLHSFNTEEEIDRLVASLEEHGALGAVGGAV